MSIAAPRSGEASAGGMELRTDEHRLWWSAGPIGHPPAHPGFLDWRDEWTLDVGFMDEDHRSLAALLSRIARDYAPPATAAYAIRRPDAPPLTDALAELAAHSRAHFEREEEVMRVDDFPGLRDHKSEHDLLLAELSMTVRELRRSGAQWLSQDLLDGLKDWLLGHVLEMDRELADFLKNPQATGRG